MSAPFPARQLSESFAYPPREWITPAERLSLLATTPIVETKSHALASFKFKSQEWWSDILSITLAPTTTYNDLLLSAVEVIKSHIALQESIETKANPDFDIVSGPNNFEIKIKVAWAHNTDHMELKNIGDERFRIVIEMMKQRGWIDRFLVYYKPLPEVGNGVLPFEVEGPAWDSEEALEKRRKELGTD